jgi:hypothetical protein
MCRVIWESWASTNGKLDWEKVKRVMAELTYILTVSEQCKADNHLDCLGNFKDGSTVRRGKVVDVWRRCECDCGHPAKFKRKSAEPEQPSAA